MYTKISHIIAACGYYTINPDVVNFSKGSLDVYAPGPAPAGRYCTGNIIAAMIYATSPKNVNASTPQTMRTMDTSMLKYCATPLHTPKSILSEVERYNCFAIYKVPPLCRRLRQAVA